MPFDRRAGVAWIERALSSRDGEPCVLLVLKHLHTGTLASSVESWKIEATSRPDELASAIEEVSRGDARTLGGLQKYVIRAYYGAEKRESDSRHAFGVRITETDSPSEGHSSEDGTTREGHLAQAHRHLEAMARQGSLNNEFAFRTLSNTIASHERTIANLHKALDLKDIRIGELMAQIGKHAEREIDLIKTREEMLTAEQERKLLQERAEKEEKRRDSMIETVKLLAPGILNRIMGKRIFPDKAGELAGLSDFVDSIEESQFLGMLELLRPEQQPFFMDMIGELQKTRDKAKKDAAALPASAPSATP